MPENQHNVWESYLPGTNEKIPSKYGERGPNTTSYQDRPSLDSNFNYLFGTAHQRVIDEHRRVSKSGNFGSLQDYQPFSRNSDRVVRPQGDADVRSHEYEKYDDKVQEEPEFAGVNTITEKIHQKEVQGLDVSRTLEGKEFAAVAEVRAEGERFKKYLGEMGEKGVAVDTIVSPQRGSELSREALRKGVEKANDISAEERLRQELVDSERLCRDTEEKDRLSANFLRSVSKDRSGLFEDTQINLRSSQQSTFHEGDEYTSEDRRMQMAEKIGNRRHPLENFDTGDDDLREPGNRDSDNTLLVEKNPTTTQEGNTLLVEKIPTTTQEADEDEVRRKADAAAIQSARAKVLARRRKKSSGDSVSSSLESVRTFEPPSLMEKEVLILYIFSSNRAVQPTLGTCKAC